MRYKPNQPAKIDVWVENAMKMQCIDPPCNQDDCIMLGCQKRRVFGDSFRKHNKSSLLVKKQYSKIKRKT